MSCRCRNAACAALILLASQHAADAQPAARLAVDKSVIGMGESVAVTTTVTGVAAAERAGIRVIPFVNGKRWGAIEETDSAGGAVHHLPLPNPGCADIQVLVEAPAVRGARASWIWGKTVPETAPRYFQHAFTFSGDASEAVLQVAVDDTATVYLNGEELGAAAGWRNTTVFSGLGDVLAPGANVLSIEAQSDGGLAGLIVRLAEDGGAAPAAVVSDGAWRVFEQPPYRWPFLTEEAGEAVQVLAQADWSPWRRAMQDWPGLPLRDLDLAGTIAPPDRLLSAPVQVTVRHRALERPRSIAGQRVGIQFEPWFTPRNASWASAHAVPLTGLYWSWNADVARQQMIWLMESGIDFLVVDWTNHLWGKTRWDERGENANEIIHATTQLLETLAQLRDEGHRPPTVVLYAGLNNGPSTTVDAVNEELAWVHHTYVRNPRLAGLFEEYLGKPLFLVHNGGGPTWADENGASRVDETYFTIRYQSFQHEYNDHAAHGFWSWMDATLEPVVTLFEGEPEALTVSSAFFSRGGWKKEGAHGRRGGWTFVEGFKQAMLHRPRFLEIHQFQEYAGQWEGFAYGPEKDLYVDSYSVELSDDIEPVSLTARAYRGDGGWGFYYLNLLRALVDCYGQEAPETTVLALDTPGYGKPVSGAVLPLRWSWVGRAPEGFRLRVNGKPVEMPADALSYDLDLTAITPGPLEIDITALGTQARYALDWMEASAPASEPREAMASVVLRYVGPEG